MGSAIHGPPAATSLAEAKRMIILSDEAEAILATARQPEDFLQQLMTEGLDADVTRVIAHFLPVRLAVWWGCLCASHGIGATLNPSEDDALRRAAHWSANPSEGNRQQASVMAEAIGLETAAGCCAAAAAAAGFAEKDAVFQADDVKAAAGLVGAAVQLAVVGSRSGELPISFRQFAYVGLDVAAGRFPWGIPS